MIVLLRTRDLVMYNGLRQKKQLFCSIFFTNLNAQSGVSLDTLIPYHYRNIAFQPTTTNRSICFQNYFQSLWCIVTLLSEWALEPLYIVPFNFFLSCYTCCFLYFKCMINISVLEEVHNSMCLKLSLIKNVNIGHFPYKQVNK